MTKTKIEWCDRTWNPVTGCLHGCEYCYARGIANRFHSKATPDPESLFTALYRNDGLVELGEPLKCGGGKGLPFSTGFAPTFHRYRLDEPQKTKKPQTIFVGSMADMFGEWVPDEWIEQVFKACEAAPWHRYLFLTKNPDRYEKLYKFGKMPHAGNMWYGTTITRGGAKPYYPLNGDVFPNVLRRGISGTFSKSFHRNTFISAEPLTGQMSPAFPFGKGDADWVIVGAETRNGKIINPPKREWIEDIVKKCKAKKVPVFMKNNLQDIWQEPLPQEFPWEVPS